MTSSPAGVRQDRRHLDVRHGQADRRRRQGRQQDVRADRRRGHRRVRRASCSTRPTSRISRARPSPTPPPSAARASPSRSSSSRARPSPRPSGAPQPNTVLLDPVLLDNTSDAGKTALKAWQSVPGLDPLWPLSLSIEGWTTYDPKDRSCILQGRIADQRSPSTGVPARRRPRPATFSRQGPMTSPPPTCCSRRPASRRHTALSSRSRPHRWRSARARSTHSWAPTAPARARW